MNIGTAAAPSGLLAKMIRAYEGIGLLEASGRRDNGYREYGEQELQRLTFVQRARSPGFAVEECRELLDLYRDRGRASADVKALARRRIDNIKRKITERHPMQATLQQRIERCHGDDRPECPIRTDRAGGTDVQGRRDLAANAWSPSEAAVPPKAIRLGASASVRLCSQGGIHKTSGCQAEGQYSGTLTVMGADRRTLKMMRRQNDTSRTIEALNIDLTFRCLTS